MKVLYIHIDFFWWYVSHRRLHIWPNGYISGPRFFDSELLHSFWCYFTHTECNIRPTEHISGKIVPNHEHSIHNHWLTLLLLQPYMSPYMTYWTYFWKICPQSWTFYTCTLIPSDDRSAIEYCIFDLMGIFLAN